MLRRFALYGFCKNQRYFEPFLLLAFREKGLSYFTIGLLVAEREVLVNLLEIPSGAIADLWGRRRAMILSFSAYIISFVVFGLAQSVWALAAAMACFAVGDAFRTGTHKAMIFTWLRQQGRTDERVAVYGYTRSWSRFGSALSALIAAGFVLVTGSYQLVFLAAVVPYLVGIINFLGYPTELDGARGGGGLGALARHTWSTLRQSVQVPGLRRIMLESMSYEGSYAATKDYLQPVLAALAVPLLATVPLMTDLGGAARGAVIIGPVYAVLFFLTGIASRKASSLSTAMGGEVRATSHLWLMAALTYAAMVPLLYLDLRPAVVLGFVALAVQQNLWRPIQIARFDTVSSEDQGATVLSIESQAKSLAIAVLAPGIGWAVDQVAAVGWGGAYWPVAMAGAMIATIVLLATWRAR